MGAIRHICDLWDRDRDRDGGGGAGGRSVAATLPHGFTCVSHDFKIKNCGRGVQPPPPKIKQQHRSRMGEAGGGVGVKTENQGSRLL